jgi:hypothetical protein
LQSPLRPVDAQLKRAPEGALAETTRRLAY